MLVTIPITGFDRIVDAMPMPLYVVAAGGIASGKTHVVGRNLTRFTVADVDDYMTKNGFTDYDRQGVQFRTCMRQIDDDIQQFKRERRNIIAMGTGANLEFLKFRLEEARTDRYRTAILHVTVPPHQARAQNEERRTKAERAVAEHQLDLIDQTIRGSAASVEWVVKNRPDLVDFICVHQNVRTLVDAA